ncbi:MAG: hypothetical protein RQ847_09115 [Wenzhouxiangellaceae bacterium]|nr:hypothetical protein [Wenzhouxiangellaceae bacterium]
MVVALSEISAHQADHRAVVQAYLQALFANILATESDPDWHREGERGVISELVRIQDRLLESYRTLTELLNSRAARNSPADETICPDRSDAVARQG